MYGYVRIYKPELRFRDWDVYRAYYCAICKSIKARYGEVARLTLSYDCVFFALIFEGFAKEMQEIKDFRCGYHPLQKRPVFAKTTDIIDYVADITVRLALIKLMDDENDRDANKILPQKLFLIRTEKRLKKNLDKLGQSFLLDLGKHMIKMTIEAEVAYKKGDGFEQVAKHFAGFFAEIFDFGDNENATELRQIGRALGMFIYMLDAYDDIEKDKKSGAFNPFLVDENENSLAIKEQIERTGSLYLQNISELYEGLGLEKNTKILDNIIYVGLYAKMKEVLDEQSRSV
jgi:hypothetical protein